MAAEGVDGKVVVEVDADASEFEKRIEEVKKSSQAFADVEKETKRNADAAIEGIKEYNDQISGLSSAYKTLSEAIQKNAETGTDSTYLYEEAQELLSQQIIATSDKLEMLRSSQEDVNNAFIDANIELDQWADYQKEISDTTKSLSDLEKEQERFATEQSNYGKTTESSTTALQNYIQSLNGVSKVTSENIDRIHALDSVMRTGKASFSEQIEAHKAYQTAIKETEKHLQELQHHENEVKKAFKKGEITGEEYSKFQGELKATSDQLTNLKSGMADLGKVSQESGNGILSLGDIIKGSLASAAIQAAVKELIQAVQELGQELTNIVLKAGEVGNTIDKQSQRLGMTTTAYQEWSYILSQNGADISTLTMGMRTLINQIDGLKNGSKSATKAFNQLGLTFADLNGLTGEEQFSLVIERLQGIEDETTRNAIANDVLGRSYMQLIPLLNQSSDSVENLRQRAHDTNQLMSDEGIQAAVDYTDAIDTLQRSFEGFKNNIGGEILPGITEIIDGITDLINGVEGAEDKITKGIEDTLKSVENIAPKVGKLLNKVVDAAGDKAPEILHAIAQAIIDGLPKISDALLKLIPIIVQTIADMLPDIGTAAATIITEIFRVLIENLTDAENTARLFNAMVEFGFNLCVGIADGIVNYDWGALTNTLLTKLGNVLDSAQRHTMLWIDNLFGGGKLYGGDINNVESTEFMKVWREGAQAVTETVDEATKAAQDYYRSGKDILTEVFKDTSKTIEDGEEQAEEVIADATESEKKAVKNYTQAIEDSTEETKKNQAKLGAELQKGLDDLDHLFNTHKITEGEYWARRKALLEKYREDDNEEWHRIYDDVKEHYKNLSDENKKAFDKAYKETQDAIAKAEKDFRNALGKDINSTKAAFNSLYKEYQAGYNSIIKERDALKHKMMGGSVFEVLLKTDEKTGQQYKQYTVNDLKKRLKEQERFADQYAALKKRNLSQGLLDELSAMDVEDANIFASQLLKMSDSEFNELVTAYDDLDKRTEELANDRYKEELDKLQTNFINEATALFDGMNVDLKALGLDGAKGFLSEFERGFDESGETVANSVNTLFDNISQAVSDGTADVSKLMSDTGSNFGLSFIMGMSQSILDGKGDIEKTIASLIQNTNLSSLIFDDMQARAVRQSAGGYTAADNTTQRIIQSNNNTTVQTVTATPTTSAAATSQARPKQETLTINANLKLTDGGKRIIAEIVNEENKRIQIGAGK